jgi:hypothetical protein
MGYFRHRYEIYKERSNMKAHKNILSIIGNTPIVKLNRMAGPEHAEKG